MGGNQQLHQHWMKRAISLAERGLGSVSPNPLVGCVIVHEGKIIGEGWHKEYGGPHAEVEAIRSVGNPDLLAESTVYVTLEPCSHFGKTPPCADLLIEKQIPRVVIGHLDPYPLVAGKGLEKLRQAGIQVEVGVLESACRFQNRRFLSRVEQQRPYIILKWAQSADGFIGKPGEQVWISSPSSKTLVHKWRTEEDAFLVGAGTAAIDNPQLNARHWPGHNPIRAVIDPGHLVPFDAHLLNAKQQTLYFTFENNPLIPAGQHIRQVLIDPNFAEESMMNAMLNEGINSVVVEGGTFTINKLLETGLWDEARIFVSNIKLGYGVAAPQFKFSNARPVRIDSDELFVVHR